MLSVSTVLLDTRELFTDGIVLDCNECGVFIPSLEFCLLHRKKND